MSEGMRSQRSNDDGKQFMSPPSPPLFLWKDWVAWQRRWWARHSLCKLDSQVGYHFFISCVFFAVVVELDHLMRGERTPRQRKRDAYLTWCLHFRE